MKYSIQNFENWDVTRWGFPDLYPSKLVLAEDFGWDKLLR